MERMATFRERLARVRAGLAALKARFDALVEAYGYVALGTYFTLFGLTIAGFYAAIQLGWDANGATATAGTIGAAYVATRMTQPIRIAATLVLTPFIARALGRSPSEPSPTP
jgi:hypothetical protein